MSVYTKKIMTGSRGYSVALSLVVFFGMSMTAVQAQTCGGSILVSFPSAHCAAELGGMAVQNQIRQLDTITNGMIAMPAQGVYSEGKMRSVQHDGYRNVNGFPNFSMDGTEKSIFAGAVYTLPKSYNGGSWQVGAFGGYTKLDINFGAPKGLVGGKQGEASHEAYIFGGLATYRKGAQYLNISMAVLPGSNSVDANKFDSVGYMAAIKLGRVFDLTESFGIKADTRAGLTYSNYDGERFTVSPGNFEETNASALIGTLGVTFYKDIAMGGGTFLKPYVMGQMKFDIGFDSEYKFQNTNFNFSAEDHFDQEIFSGLAEVGVGYFDGANSYNAALFTDTGSDRFSWGGKLRASFKLN